MILVDLAIVAMALFVIWVLGGPLLRLSGLALVVAAVAVTARSGDADGIVVFAIGVALWLAGHWHYALRHGDYKSPLAAFFFCRCAPAWLDPTRDRRTIMTTASLSSGEIRDLLVRALGHDAIEDAVTELLFEHVVGGRHERAEAPASCG